MIRTNRDNLGRFSKTKWVKLKCKTCNKEFSVIQSRGNDAKFCSPECSIKYHSGKNHHQFGKPPSINTKKKISKTLTGKYTGSKSSGWKGGLRHANGYILIYKPNHPFSSKDKYVPEHRLVVEKYLGRYLLPIETPHHINGIKDDNSIKNLYLFSTMGEHTSYHMNVMYNNLKPITKSNLKQLRKIINKNIL